MNGVCLHLVSYSIRTFIFCNSIRFLTIIYFAKVDLEVIEEAEVTI